MEEEEKREREGERVKVEKARREESLGLQAELQDGAF